MKSSHIIPPENFESPKPRSVLNLFAATPPGLEPVCARELMAIGISGVRPVAGGVEFEGTLREIYQANLWLRTASRVLVRIGRFSCRDFPTLYKKTLRLPWGRYIRPGTRLQVKASSRSSRLNHSERIGETVVAAISRNLGAPLSVTDAPVQIILARVDKDICQLSLDSSGELLHRRGYRKKFVPAPLRETLAAGVLQLLNWRGEIPLADPMCGSGTFPIEAALLAGNRSPGSRRRFAFMHWPHYREGLWHTLLATAGKTVRPPPATIHASDRDDQAVAATRHNAENAGVHQDLDIHRAGLAELSPRTGPGLLVCNPPYGKRLAETRDLRIFYRDMGHVLKRNFRGWSLALLCPESLAGSTGLPLEKRESFKNGGLEIYLFVSNL